MKKSNQTNMAFNDFQKTQKRKRRINPETPITKACLEMALYHPMVKDAWRMNTGAAKYQDAKGGTYYVKYGRNGQADITGMLITGKRLEIETKVWPKGLDEDQKTFARMIREGGGLFILAYGPDDVQKWLNSEAQKIKNMANVSHETEFESEAFALKLNAK